MFQSNGSAYADHPQHYSGRSVKKAEDSLRISTRQTIVHQSGTRELREQWADRRSEDLRQRFEEYIRQCNDDDRVQWDWKNGDEVIVSGMNNMDLHTFILEMEKEGRKVEFVKTTTIKIS